MYKVLKIGEKDYRLEYGIEASLYDSCVTELVGLLANMDIAGSEKDIKKMVSGLANIPHMTLTIFYAGLLEYHGNHAEGDGTVPDISTAKKLIAQYIKEHSEDDTGNFYGIMQMCIEQMGEDGFFKLVGLDQMMNASQIKPNRAARRAAEKASRKQS